MEKYNFGSYLKDLTLDLCRCAGDACNSVAPTTPAPFYIPDIGCNSYCLSEQRYTKQETQKILPQAMIHY